MKLYQIDAFTQKRFQGNPAAVCIVGRDLTARTMQNIALEMNLSETAFVKIYDDYCNLRWFTPASEVPLCGHATLATAFTLWEFGYWPKDKPIEFNTLSGSLYIHLQEDGLIVMDFPATVPEPVEWEEKTILEEEMGGLISEVLRVPGELILIMRKEEALRKTNPNPGFIAELAKNGVIVSAQSDGEPYHFVSRYFAPNIGITEDPVTGFMHTILTPYWSQQLNQTHFRAYQASARGGTLETELKEDRVLLKGHAVRVFETDLLF